MSKEDFIIRGIDRGRQKHENLSPVLEQAYKKAHSEVLKNPEYVLQERDFESVYTAKAVEDDIRLADYLEQKFKKDSTRAKENTKKVSEVFEAIMLMQSEMSEWLGNAHTLKTARYDDYVNKIDMIAEWSSPKEGSRILALAVDVTFGSIAIEEKMGLIKKEIDSGKLGFIRYFKDTPGDFMGTRNNVPRVVVGISEPMVANLANLWIKNDQKALGSHPLQYLFIEQIQSQLFAMRSYARKQGAGDAIRAYEQTLATTNSLLAEKAKFKDELLAEDPVAQMIRRETERQFRN